MAVKSLGMDNILEVDGAETFVASQITPGSICSVLCGAVCHKDEWLGTG